MDRCQPKRIAKLFLGQRQLETDTAKLIARKADGQLAEQVRGPLKRHLTTLAERPLAQDRVFQHRQLREHRGNTSVLLGQCQNAISIECDDLGAASNPHAVVGAVEHQRVEVGDVAGYQQRHDLATAVWRDLVPERQSFDDDEQLFVCAAFSDQVLVGDDGTRGQGSSVERATLFG